MTNRSTQLGASMAGRKEDRQVTNFSSQMMDSGRRFPVKERQAHGCRAHLVAIRVPLQTESQHQKDMLP